ncbi:hypothetical protein D3C81_2147780 [compost metagenome]
MLGGHGAGIFFQQLEDVYRFVGQFLIIGLFRLRQIFLAGAIHIAHERFQGFIEADGKLAIAEVQPQRAVFIQP